MKKVRNYEGKWAAHTIQQALEILPIGRSTIYKLVATGELRSIRVGKKLLIPDSAIYEFVERGQVSGSVTEGKT